MARCYQLGFDPASNSPYSHPVLLVKKHDGSWRMCIDYRALNKIKIKDKFPIPMIEELLDELDGACIYFEVGFTTGLSMHPNDIEKTAFHTHQV